MVYAIRVLICVLVRLVSFPSIDNLSMKLLIVKRRSMENYKYVRFNDACISIFDFNHSNFPAFTIHFTSVSGSLVGSVVRNEWGFSNANVDTTVCYEAGK